MASSGGSSVSDVIGRKDARDELEHLTPRQREIASVAATSSFSNKELAAKLGISEGTLKLHLHEIYRRLGIDGRKALIVDAIHEPGPHALHRR